MYSNTPYFYPRRGCGFWEQDVIMSTSVGTQQYLIKKLDGERFTPFGLAKKLQAKVLLESASFHKGKERYSILLVEEAFRLSQHGKDVFFHVDNERKRVNHKGNDLLDAACYFAAQHENSSEDFPIPAGGIGFLSYEFSRYCDTIFFSEKPDPLSLPDASFLFGHIFLIYDHYTDTLALVGLNYREHTIDLEERFIEIENKINDLNFNYLETTVRKPNAAIEAEEGEKEIFLQNVERIKDEITAGNLLQGVLSRRLIVQTDLSAREGYKRLRSANPSPYLFFLDFGDYQLFGSSPEVHVKVKVDTVMMRPIAGTRRRGKDKTEDRRLEKELLADEKERAEHLMLVDLARNDIGRVCVPGTVDVSEYMGIERYSHVMHIVSQTEGRLRPGMRGVDAVRATFPAGTVSGAPKIRAIETIDRLERYPRRFYAGLVGYIEADGSLDTCITIRSALKKNDTIVLQAGAGIVQDSVPEREYEETNEKLRALAKAIGVEV